MSFSGNREEQGNSEGWGIERKKNKWKNNLVGRHLGSNIFHHYSDRDGCSGCKSQFPALILFSRSRPVRGRNTNRVLRQRKTTTAGSGKEIFGAATTICFFLLFFLSSFFPQKTFFSFSTSATSLEFCIKCDIPSRGFVCPGKDGVSTIFWNWK